MQDGGALATYSLTKGFEKAGVQVKMLAMNTSRHHVDLQQLPAEFIQTTRIETIDIDNRIHGCGALLNLLSGRPYHVARFVSAGFERKLIELLRQEQFDIVQLEGLYVCCYIPVIRKYSRARIAYRAHNVESKIWERIAENSSGLKKIYLGIQARRLKNFEQQQLSKIDALVAITDNDASVFMQLGASCPVFVAPFGIDPADYPGIHARQDYLSLFHLGAMDWIPNQEGIRWFLQEVWDELHEKFPEMKFYVAGRSFPQWLKSWKQPGVIIVGKVEDSRSFISGKAIMVVPLKSGSGMRVKIIESMALGKAIVSTSIGAEGIAFTNGKNILIADTPGQFIDAISRLLSNKDYMEEMGRNAWKLVHEKYDGKIIVKELLKFYARLS